MDLWAVVGSAAVLVAGSETGQPQRHGRRRGKQGASSLVLGPPTLRQLSQPIIRGPLHASLLLAGFRWRAVEIPETGGGSFSPPGPNPFRGAEDSSPSVQGPGRFH